MDTEKDSEIIRVYAEVTRKRARELDDLACRLYMTRTKMISKALNDLLLYHVNSKEKVDPND